MTLLPLRIIIVVVFTAGFFLSPFYAGASKRMLLLDPAATTPTAVVQHDKAVSSYQLELDRTGEKPADGFVALLTGRNAGWAGVSVETPTGLEGVDALEIEAKRQGRTRGFFITLTEEDGTRWNAFVPLIKTGWHRETVLLGDFSWFSGPDARKQERPKLDSVRSLQLWVDGRFQGLNGISVAEFVGVDVQPQLRSLDVITTTIASHTPEEVFIAARGAQGESVSYNTTLWIAQHDQNKLLAPSSVQMVDGWATVSLFARSAETFSFETYDGNSGVSATQEITVRPSSLQASLKLRGVDEQSVIYMNEAATATVTMSGGNALPLTAHTTIRDQRGKTVLSRYDSVAALMGGQVSFYIPAFGAMEADVTFIAEPVEALSSRPSNYVHKQGSLEDDRLTRGLTLSKSLSFDVLLEDLPSTATVVARDRFPILSLARPPLEWRFNKWPFGIASAQLFHMPASEISSTGARRLRWHRALGSNWGRNDLWWDRIQPSPGAFSWSHANRAIQAYRQHTVRLLGILAYSAKWKNGKAPSSAEDFNHWFEYAQGIAKKYDGLLWGVEVWNEPDTELFWKPEPNPLAYAELLKLTWKAFRTSGTETIPGPHVVAGATAGISPVFVGSVLEEEGTTASFTALSMHPYPDAKGRSPEENSLAESIDESQEILRKHGASDKELWLTEVGWPSGPMGSTELDQANFVTRSIVTSLYKKVNKIFWFNLFDWERQPWAGEWGGHTGLLDSFYQPKPAAAAYNLSMFMLSSVNPKSRTTRGRATITSFNIETQSNRWPGTMHVLWTDDKNVTQTVDVAIEAGGGVYALDYLGAEISPRRASTSSATDATTGTYQFSAGYEPIFIWDVGPPPKER